MVGTPTYDFGGDVAIVTGSTKGIGRGIAGRLADADADVVANARHAEAVERAAADLDERGDGDVIGVPADVSEPEDVERLVAETLDAFGRIDLLVNNAAVWPGRPIHEMGLEEWDRGLGVNARGPFYAATLVADHMLERGDGNIVNVSSQAGERHGGGHGLYGVSKAAQNGLTWRLAYDLAPHGVRVNAVSTTRTDSHTYRQAVLDKPVEEATEAEIEAALAESASENPMGRVGRPEEIGDAVCFLASEGASYVTGHVLRVSGGDNLH
jgi:3-oxoacyl-[acyl-carrier protein] reductase